MFTERIKARDVWIAASMAIVGFTAGYGSYRAIMEAANIDKVPRGSYVLKDQLEGEYIRRDAVESAYLPREAVQRDYVPRSACTSAEETDQSIPPGLRTEHVSETPGSAGTKDRSLPQNDSPVEQDASITTNSYRFTVLSAEKIVDRITLVVELRSMTDETVSFGISNPYLLDENGERWNYRDDTAQLVWLGGAGLKLPPRSHLRGQIHFRATGSTTGTIFTFRATENGPAEGRAIVFNGMEVL